MQQLFDEGDCQVTMKMKASVLTIIFCFLLAACNTSILSRSANAPAPENEGQDATTAEPESPDSPPTTQAPLSFAVVQKQIFVPHCVRCHGNDGGVSLESFEEVTQFIPEIKLAMQENTMPPSQRRKLTQEQRDLMLRWINEGARQE